LRVFLSHSVEAQPWQGGIDGSGVNLDPHSLDFASGQGIPTWIFKVEGRLIDTVSSSHEPYLVSSQSAVLQSNTHTRLPPRKFTSFLKGLVVEFDRDPANYPDGNVLEACFINSISPYPEKFS
jgi:SWI/SNF-related matrix-associated actin-dependent regulator of chromatin subfamily D